MPSLKSLLLLGASLAATSVQATPIQSLDFSGTSLAPRADPSLTGYLGAFFLGADPYVYLYLSNGNKFGRLRERATTWDAAQRQGSKGIFVWESTDLVNWTNERLVVVENSSAGMVWAPEAIWDAAKGQYLVHWASKFYPTSDPNHTGSPGAIVIRYAYTSDSKTFSTPQTYIDKSPTNIIDLNILPTGTDGKSFVRFLKDESLKTVFVEVSTTGLFGSWTRPGGSSAVIASGVEGPASPYETTNVASNSGWTASSMTGFPSGLRHCGVLPVNQTIYDALESAGVK
ncbi:hypothetical protein BDP81DRAFT_451765 [Colletotrichum phormii]|uniref:Glycoside hydrolase family 43 protein n=1 Tax=Colletotrichum phormii TaxID=359342 RepID=A0AAI9ZKQ4_9PEZI|nr:uncharacterized protein BDP81DRAFT_451765 [Colletotrichum phormii]KAK1633785.1 hypothetical protein BDP81DRAFT_451765 [Colletotrichum phormii]